MSFSMAMMMNPYSVPVDLTNFSSILTSSYGVIYQFDCSSDGKYIAISTGGDYGPQYMLISSDYGDTFSAYENTAAEYSGGQGLHSQGLAINGDGSVIYSVHYAWYITKTLDYGSSFSQVGTPYGSSGWTVPSCSNVGGYFVVGANGANTVYSNNYGVSITTLGMYGSSYSMGDDGTFCMVSGSTIYHISGALSVLHTFTTPYTINSVKFNSDNSIICATTSDSKLIKITGFGTPEYKSISISILGQLDMNSIGTKFVALDNVGAVKISLDGGDTWSDSNIVGALSIVHCSDAFDTIYTGYNTTMYKSP